MNYVIRAVLSNAQRPEYGQVTVPFPVPNEEYDGLIEQLEVLSIGDALNQDCKVDEIDSAYSVLESLSGTTVNVDELDYLAKRLDSFCTGEDAQFQGMACKLGLCDIKDFINLTFCCQQATVITDFSDLERIGKAHALTLNDGSMLMDQYQAVDGRKEALQLIQSGGGTVTPFGVVYDNGMELEQCYNGCQFPAYLYDKCLMALTVSPKQGLEDGQYPEYICLPASSQQLERALLRSGIRSLFDAQVCLDFDELPKKVAEALDLEDISGDDLPGLNQMCQAIQPLSKTDKEKLNAVVLMTETSGTVSIRRLAENLDQFDFIPGIQTPEEYGRYMIQESGHFEYDENLEGFYNYRLYGEQHIQQEGGQFNECGYVAYCGAAPLDELMRTTPAEQNQQGLQMGGPAF